MVLMWFSCHNVLYLDYISKQRYEMGAGSGGGIRTPDPWVISLGVFAPTSPVRWPLLHSAINFFLERILKSVCLRVLPLNYLPIWIF